MRNSKVLSISAVATLLLMGSALLALGLRETTRAQQNRRGRPAAKQKERQLTRPSANGSQADANREEKADANREKKADAVEAPAINQRRIALVIGNSDYPKVPLQNPVKDARLIGETLGKLGFEVLERENLSRQEMLEEMQSFSRRLGSGGIGLFYYAGHGVQVSGRNYLVPTDFGRMASLQDVENKLLYAGHVLETMATKQGLNIVILDACRNNPTELEFPSGVSQGFAEIKNTPAGTFIAYSTSPGLTASDGEDKNSPYSAALAQSLRMRPSRLEDVFIHTRIQMDKSTDGKQVPWENSSIKTVFFLVLMKCPRHLWRA